MSTFLLPGLGRFSHLEGTATRAAILFRYSVLQRVFDFSGFTIHDVINDPIARNGVIYFYKLHREVERRSERDDPSPILADAAAGL